jgi:hypothetical protein
MLLRKETTAASRQQEEEHARYIKARLRAELVLNPKLLSDESALKGKEMLSAAIITYLTTLCEGDCNVSRERKHELFVNDVMSDDHTFETKLLMARTNAHSTLQRLDQFVATEGSAYPNIETIYNELKDSKVLTHVNCMVSSYRTI